MIEINLLPEEIKKRRSSFKKIDLTKLNVENIKILEIGAGIIVVLMVIQVTLFLVGIYAGTTLNSLDKRYQKILPEKKEADLLKTQVDAINKKTGAIDELMVKRFSWSRKLNDLSDAMTPGVWLRNLSYSDKLIERPVSGESRFAKSRGQNNSPRPPVEKVLMRYILLEGSAAGSGEDRTAAIAKFIKSLKDSESFYSDFSDIELGAIKADKIDQEEVMSFEITCLFKDGK